MITIGLIVIGIILIGIIGAFIISANFRKDVIASEGEAAVFGLINVKGVIIVLLTAIFVGAFVYIIKLNYEPQTKVMQSTVIDYLKNNNSISYSIKSNANNKGFNLWANTTKIGQVELDLNDDFALIKNPNSVDEWFVEKGDSQLGTVSVRIAQEQHFWHRGQNPAFYEQKKAYKVGDLDFYFRIDSIYSIKSDTTSIPYYVFSFGEGNQPDNVKWRRAKEEYSKTDNGNIDLNNGLKHIFDKQWMGNYYVGLGVGLPGGVKSHVEMLNIVVIQSKLE